jgi:hypothetical protein
MKKVVFIIAVILTASCSKDSEQYCEIVDYKNNHLTNGWEETRRNVTTEYDEETTIFDRYQDGFRHKRVVECYDVFN